MSNLPVVAVDLEKAFNTINYLNPALICLLGLLTLIKVLMQSISPPGSNLSVATVDLDKAFDTFNYLHLSLICLLWLFLMAI